MAGTYKVDKSITDQICEYYNLNEIKTKLVPNRFASIEVERSYLLVTEFGKMFINACVE